MTPMKPLLFMRWPGAGGGSGVKPPELHVRGQPFGFDISGDLHGTTRGVINFNIDLATGNGDASGSFTIDVTGSPT